MQHVSTIRPGISTDRRSGVSPEMAQAISAAFARIASHYGAKLFESRYGDECNQRLQKLEWALALQQEGVTPAEIEHGSRAVITRCEYPPRLAEFRAMCRVSPEMLGLPSLESAYLEAVRNAHPAASPAWSHQAVCHAATEVGFWNLAQLPGEKSRELFERAYTITCRMIMTGEPLREIPKALPAEVSIPARPETARAHLAAMRGLFGASTEVTHDQPQPAR